MGNNDQKFVNIINLPDNFNTDISSNEDISTTDFESLLNELNKQVSTADGSINELMRKKDIIEKNRRDLEEKNEAFKEERISFDIYMKEEQQKLGEAKKDLEQEKNRFYNEIQELREELARKKRDFEKYRQEQILLIKEGKKTLTNNYKQFEKIVATFNDKIDNFN